MSKGKEDFNQLAYRLVQELTAEKAPGGKSPLVSAALDDETLRKQVMREMGKRGGQKGGKARAQNLTAEQRSEIAKKAAKSRWKSAE